MFQAGMHDEQGDTSMEWKRYCTQAKDMNSYGKHQVCCYTRSRWKRVQAALHRLLLLGIHHRSIIVLQDSTKRGGACEIMGERIGRGSHEFRALLKCHLAENRLEETQLRELTPLLAELHFRCGEAHLQATESSRLEQPARPRLGW